MTESCEPATAERSGRYPLGDRAVHRVGFGGMKLSGPRFLGPPADREAALAVLRRAVELGVDHIDTSGLYGPHVVNDLIFKGRYQLSRKAFRIRPHS